MIGLVTAAMARPIDTDLDPLVAAFAGLGRHVDVVAWDDPDVEWRRFDALLLRSTWDYPLRYDDFLAWLERADAVTRLWNPAPVVRWNTDKRYLGELADAGVPVVPTSFVEPGTAPPRLGSRDRVVVKPSVGAGAFGVEAVEGADVSARVAALHREGRTAMVQPYVDLIDDAGEIALVYLGDGTGLRFSHAFRKGAVLKQKIELDGDLVAAEHISPHTATPAERALGDAVLASAPVRQFGSLAYARVDTVPTERGPALLELELVEPSIYVSSTPGSADAAAAAWLRLVDA